MYFNEIFSRAIYELPQEIVTDLIELILLCCLHSVYRDGKYYTVISSLEQVIIKYEEISGKLIPILFPIKVSL